MPPENNQANIIEMIKTPSMLLIMAILSSAIIWGIYFSRQTAYLTTASIIQSQLAELNKLPQPLNQNDINEQLQNLDKSDAGLSEDEIKKQLEELNNK